MTSLLRFESHNFFRQRLLLAALSGRPVRIDRIRSEDDNPGLRDCEAGFLRLMEKVTNGSAIEISYTGTTVVFKPGVIVGGRVQHDCGTERGIGYYLEALIALAPFTKTPIHATLTGITSDNQDVSVDTLRTVTLVNLKRWGLDAGIELKITKRGAPPLGGGEVTFHCPNVRALKPIQFTDEGKIKRVRGIAYSTRVSPQTANRLVDAARNVLGEYLPDVYIYTDHYKGQDSGRSPGFAVSLVAESTTGVLLSTELAAEAGQTPEEVGEQAAYMLLKEVGRGGCIDTTSQWLALLLMVLGPEDVSKIRLGALTPFTVQFLRDLKKAFGTVFKVAEDEETNTLLLTCMGVGYVNVNKKTT
ncbi:RNA 3'-terminal phosphate cyclase/enolpyruvate transferase [Thamnocephalis sphaerospora]|uniref:RNA 3'-terminal phosphate cyclase/enolpyruvate transferase n=1 Tax=Thamnocephalis sphaerospora TaxID=78915 RepID=A0A4P9XLP9_9FUNG|nr:RNA 3'-terminal phosphate cyclase/enolpyruvate transferase [Thamnocephalis sphaerospora]|eukprot:RKP06755.1 RNA 3'-terminal phosphate cyclase/enolpyruvate transferase [Thamnocephalis sphaerospora]